MNLSNLPEEILEIIFDKLSFTDKVSFTSLKEFKFLRNRNPSNWKIELPILLFKHWYHKIRENEHSYFTERLDFFIKFFERNNICLNINNDLKIFTVTQNLDLILNITKCTTNTYQLFIKLSNIENIQYDYDSNTFQINLVRYFKNGILHKQILPKHPSDFEICLSNNLSKIQVKKISELSPLFTGDFGKIPHYHCYNKWSLTENGVETKVIEDLSENMIKYTITIPLIYTGCIRSNLPTEFSKEELQKVVNFYAENDGLVTLELNEAKSVKLFSYQSAYDGHDVWTLATHLDGVKHGPVFRLQEKQIQIVGNYVDDEKDNYWICDKYISLYKNGALLEKINKDDKKVIYKIDEQYHELASKVKNWHDLGYRTDNETKIKVENGKIIRTVCERFF